MTSIQIPARYQHAAIAHIMVKNAVTAIDFYQQAFDAQVRLNITSPEGQVIHAEIMIGQSLVMLGDATAPFATPQTLGASAVGLHVYVSDVDAFTEHAKKSGVKELQPPQDMFYGARQSMMQDPYGHIWIFLTHTEDLSTQEIEQRARQLFKQ